MGYCPSCGTELDPEASFCPSCGQAVAEGTVGGQSDSAANQEQGGASDSENERAAEHDPGTEGTAGTRSGEAAASGNAPGGASTGPAGSGAGGMSRRALIAGGVGGGAVALGAVAVLGGGIAGSSPPLGQLNVRFVDVRRPDAGVTTATVPLIIAIENPTDQEISGLSGDLDILINDQRVASDDVSVASLDPGEETNVDLDVIVEYAESGEAIREALTSGSFEITIQASLEAGGAERTVERSTSL